MAEGTVGGSVFFGSEGEDNNGNSGYQVNLARRMEIKGRRIFDIDLNTFKVDRIIYSASI